MLECACQVWHSNLPQYLCNEVESVQKQALKAIYPECSYVKALQVVGLTTLEDQRYELCKSYLNRMLNLTTSSIICCPARESFPIH